MVKIEIIGMIYKSSKYLELLNRELLKEHEKKYRNYFISAKIVANDPTQKIIDLLGKNINVVPFIIYNDKRPNDYYLNRVYRCWNFAGKTSEADIICFVNSDMVFSDGWIESLLDRFDCNIPCSRLIESGKMESGQHGISKNFGQSVDELNFDMWYKYAEKNKIPKVENGGLFMPCLFNKNIFIESGMYPEGNIYADGIGTLNGSVIESGDKYYFNLLYKKYGLKHITVFDSLVYHIQEGEKDE
jgi:hypothetical protein